MDFSLPRLILGRTFSAWRIRGIRVRLTPGGVARQGPGATSSQSKTAGWIEIARYTIVSHMGVS